MCTHTYSNSCESVGNKVTCPTANSLPFALLFSEKETIGRHD